MKKYVLSAVFFLAVATLATAQVEEIAREVLKAHKDRDPELLKKNASGILKGAINENYFKDEEIQEELKVVDQWDGKISEIRYGEENMFGNKVKIAGVHFADHPDKEDEIYWVVLSKFNKNRWVMFARGIVSGTKTEFEEISMSAKKGGKKKNASKNFSVEMANGDTFDNVSSKKLEKLINELDGDNFFMILNKGDKDFLQAAYSEKGYSVQYKENNKQYEAAEVLNKEKTTELFKSYFECDKDWKKDIKWQSF